MIRLFVLAIASLLAPFVAWFVWQVFGHKPVIDPATGDQVPPDFQKAPRRALMTAGVVLAVLVVGGFLLAQQLITDKPYRPINVDKYEKKQLFHNPDDGPLPPQRQGTGSQ